MKIVNRKKFIRSIILIVVIVLIVLFFISSTSFSHKKVEYKYIHISNGDTLWDIAKQEQQNNKYFENKDIREIIYSIQKVNSLNESTLNIGQKLMIPVL